MQVEVLTPWLSHKARSRPCTTLVLHATAGSSAMGAIETLRKRGLSYHLIFPKAMEPIKCAPLSGVAYHAGESRGPDGRFVNAYSVGFSFVNLNDGRDPYTPFQVECAIELAKTLPLQFPELKWVTTHAIVSPHRKTDPLGFDLDQFAAAVGLKAWRP